MIKSKIKPGFSMAVSLYFEDFQLMRIQDSFPFTLRFNRNVLEILDPLWENIHKSILN